MGDRDAQTGTGTTATGAPDIQPAANDLQQFVEKAAIANMAEIQLGQARIAAGTGSAGEAVRPDDGG